jgi:DNA polymerase epsilon subunit 3
MSDNKIPDFEPPAACVQRILKQALPDNILMTQDARRFIVRAVGIFIFYITHGANDFSRESKRQTIYPQDVINSLK